MRSRNARSSCSQILIKISVLKNFAIFTEKHLCWSLFLRNLQVLKPASLLKEHSNTDVFLWILQSFKNSLFYKTPLVAASVIETLHTSNFKIYENNMTQHNLKWFFPRSVMATMPHILPHFQNNFVLGEATSSHFFRVTTLGQQFLFAGQLFLQNNCFFLLFHNSYFFAGLIFIE